MLPKSNLWLFCVHVLVTYPCSREEGVCVYICVFHLRCVKMDCFMVFRWFYCGILFNVFVLLTAMVCKAVSRD